MDQIHYLCKTVKKENIEKKWKKKFNCSYNILIDRSWLFQVFVSLFCYITNFVNADLIYTLYQPVKKYMYTTNLTTCYSIEMVTI